MWIRIQILDECHNSKPIMHLNGYGYKTNNWEMWIRIIENYRLLPTNIQA